jgi:hypothetical protein
MISVSLMIGLSGSMASNVVTCFLLLVGWCMVLGSGYYLMEKEAPQVYWDASV